MALAGCDFTVFSVACVATGEWFAASARRWRVEPITTSTMASATSEPITAISDFCMVRSHYAAEWVGAQ